MERKAGAQPITRSKNVGSEGNADMRCWFQGKGGTNQLDMKTSRHWQLHCTFYAHTARHAAFSTPRLINFHLAYGYNQLRHSPCTFTEEFWRISLYGSGRIIDTQITHCEGRHSFVSTSWNPMYMYMYLLQRELLFLGFGDWAGTCTCIHLQDKRACCQHKWFACCSSRLNITRKEVVEPRHPWAECLQWLWVREQPHVYWQVWVARQSWCLCDGACCTCRSSINLLLFVLATWPELNSSNSFAYYCMTDAQTWRQTRWLVSWRGSCWLSMGYPLAGGGALILWAAAMSRSLFLLNWGWQHNM